MPASIKSVTMDCSNALVVANFWAAALGATVQEGSTAEHAHIETASGRGTTIWFQKVPEGKQTKNRQHFDLVVDGDLEEGVSHLCNLGARILTKSPGIIVMADPEGNEFCVEK